MATGDAYYRGGPKDRQIQLASDEPGYLIFDNGKLPAPWYKLTDETISRGARVYRVAQFVGMDEDETLAR